MAEPAQVAFLAHFAALRDPRQVAKVLYSRDLVGFRVGGDLAEQQPLTVGPDMYHVQRRLLGCPVERTPRTLAIDRYHPLQALGEALHEAHETRPERLGVKAAEYPAEGVVAGDTVTQFQELAQEGFFGAAKFRHIRAVLAAAQHGAQRDDQDLEQIMPDVILPWVGDFRKARDERFHGAPPE